MRRKRTFTEEEIAARDARKARVRELATAIVALKPLERVKLADQCVLRSIGERGLSAFNTLLILRQNPQATLVGGFHQWKDHGRSVRKGEHGVCIYVPTGRKNENGDVEELVSFVTGTLFDVTQTEPIELFAKEAP